MRILKTRSALMMLAILCAAPVFAQIEEINLARVGKRVEQYVAGKLITEIYKRNNIVAQIEGFPSIRASRKSSDSEVDGEVGRIEEYAETNSHLKMVTPAYYSVAVAAYSLRPIVLHTMDDLKQYRLGVVRGIKSTEKLARGASSIEYANDSDSLFSMLRAGRFDIAIDTKLNATNVLNRASEKNVLLLKELARSPLYHYLNVKRASLAQPLSKTISDMIKSGELDALTRKFEQEAMQMKFER
ncbi:substrate-binding periplasmic protein [Undibacterium sp. TJN19]